MAHRVVSLDGPWRFCTDPTESLGHTTLNDKLARTVQVPAPLQTEPDLRDFVGVSWYWRVIKLSAAQLRGCAAVLCFDAVDYLAEVWVNGVRAGVHEGGYLPFAFDVSALLKPGPNRIVVRVDDAARHFPEIPHGKQSWYGPISGLWQSVRLELRPLTHLTELRLTPHDQQIDVAVRFNVPLVTAGTLTFTVSDGAGKRVSETDVEALTGAHALTHSIALPKPPKLWDIDTPHLYTVTARLRPVGAPADQISALEDSCGFRTIESRDGRLWLNGRPVYLRSALDQDYYPDGIYTAPSQEYIEAQFKQAKAMGLNSLRIHIKIGDPRYYKAADKIGLLIWTEMPNWQLLTDATRTRARETFEGMLARDWNRPSIVIRSVINEAWGIDMFDPSHRAWLAQSYDWLKQSDPTRLVVDNSACHGNFHVVTDIDDMHVYYAIPDHYAQFRDFTHALAARPKWTFAPAPMPAADRARLLADHWHADWIAPDPANRRRGDEPLMVSEFGNWGLPDLDQLRAHYGGDPWWFKTGLQHGSGEVYPDGVDERYRLYHLARAFPTLKHLTDASQEMQRVAFKFELEEMRRHASIQGYVITEFTDLHWECNGMLDMARNPKLMAQTFHEFNADDVILPQPARFVYWEGETVRIPLSVSHYSQRDLAGARVAWTLEGAQRTGELASLNPVPFAVTPAGEIVFRMPTLARNRRLRVTLSLRVGGEVVARNHVDVYGFMRASGKPLTRASIHAPEHADALRAMGYRVVDKLGDAALAVCGHFTDALRDYALAGGRVLWLAETDDAQQSALYGMGGAHITRRAGTAWSGDWASSFSWLNRDVLFKDVPTDGLLDFAFADLTPEYVINGIHPSFYATDVHAGLFVGWVHKTAALVAGRRVGAGSMMISTFRLREHMTTNPLAALLLRDLIGA
jgi:Glycosyl hydrolases family 2, sugar binding domain/Glycosyl hydrolases family 2, TIM barrel domain/Glycosyl hydrolases family 2